MPVREFLLKKFPKEKYFDCPVPSHHWGTIQEYANEYHESKIKENSEHVRKEKILFAIEQLKELNNTLESKRVTLTKILAEKVGKITYERLNAKIQGLDFTKEDLRRQIQELEKQLL